MDTNSPIDSKPTTEAKPTPRKFWQFDFNIATITELITGLVKTPEELTALLEEYKSGIFVATLWLTLYLRSWLSVLPLPIPSLTNLPLLLLALISISLTTPAGTLTGLANYAYNDISSSTSLFNRKIIPIVLLFPIAHATKLLAVLAVWSIVGKYRNDVARVTKDADHAIRAAVSASQKAGEYVREAKGLEMQALQLATNVADSKDTESREIVDKAKKVKTQVEKMGKDVGRLGGKVEEVRALAERAKGVAEEGNLELAQKMVVNTGTLVDYVVRMEENIKGMGEGARGKLWELALGGDSD